MLHARAGIASAQSTCPCRIHTTAEQGYDISHQQSRGIVMNAGVKEEVLAYYSDLFQQVAETDEWKDFTEKNAMSNIFLPYDQYAAYAEEMLADYTEYLALANANQ